MENVNYRPATEMTPGRRAAALFKEAQALAEANLSKFLNTLEATVELSSEIADGGDLYPSGVRDICKKLAEQTTYRVQAISSIMRLEQPGVSDRDSREVERPSPSVDVQQPQHQPPPSPQAPSAATEPVRVDSVGLGQSPGPFPGHGSPSSTDQAQQWQRAPLDVSQDRSLAPPPIDPNR